MLEAIARKAKEKKVLTLYYDLIELKGITIGILALLVRQCNQLLQVKRFRLSWKRAMGMIAKADESSSICCRKVKKIKRKMFSMDTLRDMIEACAKTDESI